MGIFSLPNGLPKDGLEKTLLVGGSVSGNAGEIVLIGHTIRQITTSLSIATTSPLEITIL